MEFIQETPPSRISIKKHNIRFFIYFQIKNIRPLAFQHQSMLMNSLLYAI